MKKVLSFLIVIFLVATPLSTIAESMHTLSDDVLSSALYVAFSDGSEEEPETLYVDKDGNGVMPQFGGGIQLMSLLPDTYDLRDYGWSTSVKHQGYTGYCWAFSAMASMESNVLKRELEIKDQWKTTRGNGTSELAFSPAHIGTFAFDDAVGAEGIEGDYYSMGYRGTSGGNIYTAASLLATGAGPQLEQSYPLSVYTYGKDEASRFVSYYKLDDMYCIPMDCQNPYSETNEQAIQRVKAQIMENGAAAIHHYPGTLYRTTDGNGNAVASLYTPWVVGVAGHAATVIGWDDSFHFFSSGAKPQKAGAWLVKESYGTDRGVNGYIWISYYDPSITTIDGITANPGDAYDTAYQYDGAMPNVLLKVQKTANIFTAKQEEIIDSLGFYIYADNTEYCAQIYKNLTDPNDPESGTLCATVSDFVPVCGYITPTLEDTVTLSAGDTFSVVLTQTLDGEETYSYIERSGYVYFQNIPMTYSSRAGESFIYDTDVAAGRECWMDTKNISGGFGNVAIKAYTRHVEPQTDTAQLESALSRAKGTYGDLTQMPEGTLLEYWDMLQHDVSLAETVLADPAAKQYEIDNAEGSLTALLNLMERPTEYHIYTSQDFEDFVIAAATHSAGAIRDVYLEADITINDPATSFGTDEDGFYMYERSDAEVHYTISMGTMNEPFTADFHGQGHSISGLCMVSSNAYTGLFGHLTGTVSDLTIKDSLIVGGGTVGAVAGAVGLGGSVQNCAVEHTTVLGYTGDATYLGGTVGRVLQQNIYVEDASKEVAPEIASCAVENSFVGGYRTVGGVIGGVTQAADISDISFTGTVAGQLWNNTQGCLGVEIGTVASSVQSRIPYYGLRMNQADVTLHGALYKKESGTTGEVAFATFPEDKIFTGLRSSSGLTFSELVESGQTSYTFQLPALTANEVITVLMKSPAVSLAAEDGVVTVTAKEAQTEKTLIAAIYSSEKQLIKVVYQDVTMEAGSQTYNLGKFFTLSAGDTVKYMLLEDFQTMKPLADCVE